MDSSYKKYHIRPFVSGFFYLANVFKVHNVVAHTTFRLFIHPLVGTWIVSTSWTPQKNAAVNIDIQESV